MFKLDHRCKVEIEMGGIWEGQETNRIGFYFLTMFLFC